VNGFNSADKLCLNTQQANQNNYMQ